MSPWATADADSDQARAGPLVVARPDRWEANGPKGSRQKKQQGPRESAARPLLGG